MSYVAERDVHYRECLSTYGKISTEDRYDLKSKESILEKEEKKKNSEESKVIPKVLDKDSILEKEKKKKKSEESMNLLEDLEAQGLQNVVLQELKNISEILGPNNTGLEKENVEAEQNEKVIGSNNVSIFSSRPEPKKEPSPLVLPGPLPKPEMRSKNLPGSLGIGIPGFVGNPGERVFKALPGRSEVKGEAGIPGLLGKSGNFFSIQQIHTSKNVKTIFIF